MAAAGERADPYRSVGVDYELLDHGKRAALAAALSTSAALQSHGGRAIDASRGEPAFLFEFAGRTLAIVLETLGTKSVITREVYEAAGADHFADVAYDSVAAIVNDLICVGALPLVVNAYFATGTSDWYRDSARSESLIEGWQRACHDAGAVWGGGESPSLTGLVNEADIELAGSAVGAVPEGSEPILGERLGPGDEIVFIASSGLHTNGASLARSVARSLPEGYETALDDGSRFGEALLAPTVIYVSLVKRLLEDAVPVHYLSHITGHGFLKLMRPPAPLTYRVRELPPVPPVLSFLADSTGMDDRTAYRTLNMGAGFAVYCAEGSADAVVELARTEGVDAIRAGAVEEGARRVIIEPKDIEYADEELQLAPS